MQLWKRFGLHDSGIHEVEEITGKKEGKTSSSPVLLVTCLSEFSSFVALDGGYKVERGTRQTGEFEHLALA
jgi:hypothetical protein